MKKLIYLVFILFISINTFGQRGDKIRALKISFFSDELNLSEKEAEQFWPIYNAYYSKTSKIKRQDLRTIRKELLENKDSISDERANELLNKLIMAMDNIHKEESNLISKLQNILPSKKILLLKIAEEDFKRKLLNEFKKKHRGNK